ncbi:MAG: chemotaxis protein CheW [Flavobacteriaceae bacterium]
MNGAEDSQTKDTREYVTVTIGKQLFGLPIDRVHDVFTPHNMTPVPLARNEIAGVLNLRGRIVTAIDMRRRLGIGPRDGGQTPMAVGVESRGESYGIIIDGVGEVLRLPVAGLEPVPANLDKAWSALATGIHRLDGHLLVVLDVNRVLELGDDAPMAA